VICGSDDTQSPVNLGGGNWQHTQFVTVPIRASRPGTTANTPFGTAGTIADRIFDAATVLADRFTGGSIKSAGGSSGVTDEQVRALAKAMGRGRYGANNSAAIAGCLSDPRVRRCYAKLDYKTALLWLYVADASWATSAKLRAEVKQALFDSKWLGFGARITMGRIYNQTCTARATLILRDAAYQAERTEITANVQAAVQRYLDERADFYTWNVNALGGVMATADPRVLTCQSPHLRAEGSALAIPPVTIAGGATDIPHYNLQGVELTFATPGSAP
jgi:hypothetical protein